MEGAALHAIPQWQQQQVQMQQLQHLQQQQQQQQAYVPHHQMSARTTMLARKVAEAKAQRLGCFEHFLSKTLGTLVTAPSLFLSGFVTVPANTAVAIFRFGKLDVILNRPGLYWLPVFFEGVTTFTGTQTHKMDELHVVDAAGNPIIVRALLEFAIEDPAALKIATNMSLAV